MENIATKVAGANPVSDIPPPQRSLRVRIASLIPRARLVPGIIDYILLRRFPFAAWVHLRRVKWAIYFALFPNRHPALKTAMSGVSEHDKAHTIPHNAAQVGAITRYRTERLINVLRAIEKVDKKNADLLCIGPRNEAELLLFKLYGFNLKRIKSIDLFSYSPLIDVMDMHKMTYADSSFDVLYSSYVLRYSPDIRLACKESVRVLRNGGLMAAAFVTTDKTTYNIAASELKGGVNELLGYFGDNVDHVYWQEVHRNEDESRTCTVIFSIKK